MMISVIAANDSARDAIRAWLEQISGEVRVFARFREYFEAYDGRDDDCIVIDVSIPPCDSAEFVGQLRRSGVATPIVMLTTSNEATEIDGCLRFGAVQSLVEPYDEEALVNLVRLTLESPPLADPWPPLIP